MNRPSLIRKSILAAIFSAVIPATIYIIAISHTAWGDDRYVQKTEDVRQEIRRLDTQLTVIDQEILFAESERQKQKFEAIKAIYEREKEALTREIEQ